MVRSLKVESMPQIILTKHAKQRVFERGLDTRNVKNIAKNGKATNSGPDGIIKTGVWQGKTIDVVIQKIIGNKIKIITAYEKSIR
jgi:hypothetical protein